MRRPSLLLRAITGVYLIAVAAITLTPQSSTAENGLLRAIVDLLAPVPVLGGVDVDTLEFIANIVLFVPAGVLGVLLAGRRRWWVALVAGVMLTAVIETAQFGIPNRVPDVRDLVANTIGTAIGILLIVPGRLPRRRGHGVDLSHERASRDLDGGLPSGVGDERA